jgi:endonuclease/exonuclease/phosphatase family metal-dependent hydrolase
LGWRTGVCEGDVVSFGAPMTVVTFNLRFANETDQHPWSARRPILIRQIADIAPAVLATQEGLRSQLDDVALGLPDHYAWVGTSRKGATEDEYCAVFYDQRRLELVAADHQWLSETPDVPGSVSWGRLPRMLTAVSFRDAEAGELLVVNTHFDHWSLRARRFGADQLVSYLRTHAQGRPVVVMGDFNTGARISRAYRSLLDTPLVDVFDVAERPGPEHPTFANYQPPRRRGPRIDWLLVSPDVAVVDCAVDDRSFDGAYASDHLPVTATLCLPIP